MYDLTPSPLGDLTRRWTLLPAEAQTVHALRIVGAACLGDAVEHVDRPSLDAGVCYQQVARAALAGDAIAVGWLLTSHRPSLMVRGRGLLVRDPSEWGAACLELFHKTLASLDLHAPRADWLRFRVSRELGRWLTRTVDRHVRHARREPPSPPVRLHAVADHEPGPGTDPHPDLTVELDRLLGRLDAPTREGLWALANHGSLAEVALAHGLSYSALRQRVTRARQRLQPQLAGFRRAAC